MALKPALVSAIALACCAPLSLPFFLLIALFRSQESVVLQLHSQVHNSLCKMELPQSGLSKGSRELQAGFPHGTGCVGQQEVKCGESMAVWGDAAGACSTQNRAEEGRVHTELWAQDRHVLRGHPLMDGNPCQPMHGHYSLQDSKSPIHYSKAYFFFLFPLQWSINDLNKSYSFGTCNAWNVLLAL